MSSGGAGSSTEVDLLGGDSIEVKGPLHGSFSETCSETCSETFVHH